MRESGAAEGDRLSADRDKTIFISVMSHILQNVLSVEDEDKIPVSSLLCFPGRHGHNLIKLYQLNNHFSDYHPEGPITEPENKQIYSNHSNCQYITAITAQQHKQ